jgi:lysine-N-methylase
MVDKKKCIRMPLYFKEFQCIGGVCEDNCCIGWDVEIDQKTYHKYQKTKDKELSQAFRNFIYENPDSYDRNVDYAIVELGKNNRCPFLNEQQLCRIQAKLGHDFLSNVCAAYPRYANEINGVTEYSLNVSCPEAARLVLANRQGLAFSMERYDPSPKIIINFVVDTGKHAGNIMVEYFMELRNFTISLLQNRKYPLWERILLLGHFYKELQDSIQKRNTVPVPKLLETFSRKIVKEDQKNEISSILTDSNFQFRLMREITDKQNNRMEIDSQRYLRFTDEFFKGLDISADSDPAEEEKSYRRAYEQYYEPFMKSHEYLIENYLVNYVFGGLFPAAESTKPFESYRMLAIRYALIEYYLIGISAFRRGLTEEDCIQFIQVFSKAIEHHHTYLESIASYMKRRKYDTLPCLELLIRNFH